MDIPQYFYRGDNKNSLNKPKNHYLYGLMTKVIQGGNPAYISSNGLLNSIIAHVSPRNEFEMQFCSKSQFLSVTESIDVAKYYASEQKPLELVETGKYKETRNIFIFDLSRTKIIKRSSHSYTLQYKCNTGLIEPLSASEYDLLPQDLIAEVKCPQCEAGINSHRMLLFDVVSILREYPEYCVDNLALDNALKDKEWLLLPFDYKPELSDYSAVIPRADFWSAKYFHLKTEAEEDENIHKGGIMIDE